MGFHKQQNEKQAEAVYGVKRFCEVNKHGA